MVVKRIAEPLGLLVWALVCRVAGAAILGEGAPFGPDGTGAEASVHIEGHLYPLHIAALSAIGSARTLSVATGATSVKRQFSCTVVWG